MGCVARTKKDTEGDGEKDAEGDDAAPGNGSARGAGPLKREVHGT